MTAAALVLDDAERVTTTGAELVANRLRGREGMRLVLPTGHTPLAMYEALRRKAAAGRLGHPRALLFQLDEYVGLGPDDPRSFAAYLRRELGPLPFAARYELDGRADAEAECDRHQRLLDAAPLDLVVLGLGRDGHVAFEEPGSLPSDRMRAIDLHPTTRAAAASDFGGEEHVPRRAMTVGLSTLLAAHELLLLVTGEAKADALAATLLGPEGPDVPASFLRDHPRLTVLADRAAASRLPREARWESGEVVVVLGHREPAFSRRHLVSRESGLRLAAAERICRQRPVRAVILSGRTTTGGASEAERMAEAWRDGATPRLLELSGRDTAETAARALPMVGALGGIERVTVVTSAWHLRARACFAPYRLRGLRVGFRVAPTRAGWLRMLLHELGNLPRVRDQVERAYAEVDLP